MRLGDELPPQFLYDTPLTPVCGVKVWVAVVDAWATVIVPTVSMSSPYQFLVAASLSFEKYVFQLRTEADEDDTNITFKSMCLAFDVDIIKLFAAEVVARYTGDVDAVASEKVYLSRVIPPPSKLGTTLLNACLYETNATSRKIASNINITQNNFLFTFSIVLLLN
jgi:hypothetical protein